MTSKDLINWHQSTELPSNNDDAFIEQMLKEVKQLEADLRRLQALQEILTLAEVPDLAQDPEKWQTGYERIADVVKATLVSGKS